MKYTLKDIAKESGFSIATVSRFLCGKRRYYNLKEQKIFKLANKLNYPYIQNFYNNGIKLKVTLATSIKKGEYFSSLLSDFHIAAKDSYCDLEIINLEKNDFLTNKLNSLSKTRDGICILFPNLSKNDCNILDSYINRIPILSLSPLLDGSIDSMTFDNYKGGYIAAQHLHKAGYENMGIITGDDSVFEAFQRKNGFIDYMDSNNLNCSWEFKGDYSIESGNNAFLNFQKNGMTNIGIFGVNDYMCFGFMKLALLSGIKIPDQLSIIGFDNTPFCNNSIPELSSISTNFIELGKRALSSIEKSFISFNKNISSTNLVPVDLIERSSTRELNI
jgi:DNA-binding LacI/PurR family transcriptional regulator